MTPKDSMVEHYAELICHQLGLDPFQALPQVQGERMTTQGGLVADLLRAFRCAVLEAQ
jgi:hypothetical protein